MARYLPDRIPMPCSTYLVKEESERIIAQFLGASVRLAQDLIPFLQQYLIWVIFFIKKITTLGYIILVLRFNFGGLLNVIAQTSGARELETEILFNLLDHKPFYLRKTRKFA